MIAKDRIPAFARAPFTEFQQPGGAAEVEERARGEGLRRTIGELLVCPLLPGDVGLGRIPPGPGDGAQSDTLRGLGGE